MRATTNLAALALLAIAVGGCGITNPYSQTTTAATAPQTAAALSATVSNADPVPERGGTIPAADQRQGLARNAAAATPQAALTRYANLYINWTAQTLAANQRRLAGLSTGQAHAQALQAAASAGNDSTLLASHVQNHGTVLSIAPGQGPIAGSWVIVTQEKTLGQGDYTGLPATPHVTFAQVTHSTAGWIVSQWAPQT